MRRVLGLGSSLRWGAAAALGLLAVSQAARALTGLSGGASLLGAGAILALAVLTVLGFLELLRARLRIGEELLAMNARPPAGRLIEARRARLSEIAAVGGHPDPAVLAERASADERGRAYLGRYLVGVAVLIGLVGTFSGLAQALRGLPAIVAGADALSLPKLLSAPLAGLDLVFAAGVVGILSTLTLALAQGDLQLHEEQALARLEDETTHALIPTLWPSAQSSEARAVRELGALRGETQALSATLVAAVEAQTQTLAASLSEARHALAGLLGGAGGAIERASLAAIDALGESSRAATTSMESAARAIESVARTVAHEATADRVASREAMAAVAVDAAGALRSALDASVARLEDGLSSSRADLSAALSSSRDEHEAALASSRCDLDATLAVRQAELQSTLAAHRADLAATLAASREALDRLVERFAEGALGPLAGSADKLTAAASTLAGAQERLAPHIETLAPELRGLTQEVALLGARSLDDAEQPLFADELVRLGDSVARIEALVRMAQGAEAQS